MGSHGDIDLEEHRPARLPVAQIVPGYHHIRVVAPAPGMEAGAAVVEITAGPPPSRRKTTRTASGSRTGTEESE
ncbi:hypothetical protein AB0D04_27055 [Streptomyces sp. NPDC048483]|uniref:hypothetical protein n=1 Tax=Streptomyces sp. NPDC048483 TaxID=3154927 RepID=UPI0034257E61